MDLTWRAVLLADPCVYCSGVATSLDHIHPASRGGEDHWKNIAPACGPCNNDKANYSLLAFLVGAKIAASVTASRRYATSESRRQALEMIRTRIAEQFYRGNIRGIDVFGVSDPSQEDASA